MANGDDAILKQAADIERDLEEELKPINDQILSGDRDENKKAAALESLLMDAQRLYGSIRKSWVTEN